MRWYIKSFPEVVIGSVNVREKDNVQANNPLITVIDLSVLDQALMISADFAACASSPERAQQRA